MAFKLILISPNTKVECLANYISLNDQSGRLGIKANHAPYITLLDRSIGYYLTETNKHYFAFDQGMLRVTENGIYIVSRLILTGSSLEDLKKELKIRVDRLEYSSIVQKNIQLLQQALLKQLVESER